MHSAIRSPEFSPIGPIGLQAVGDDLDRRLGDASFQPRGFFGVSLINEAGRWRAVIARHEIERRAHKALGARFRLTVTNFPIARPTRYRIATLSWICCGTM